MLCLRTSRALGSQRATMLRAGFSLVELIVVLVIIGMLSGIVAISTKKYLQSAKRNEAKAEIAILVGAVDSFYAELSRYPTNEEGLGVLAEGTDESPGGFLKKIKQDPWNRDYEYNSPGSDGNAYEVICLGADGREGGEGENQDITSF